MPSVRSSAGRRTARGRPIAAKYHRPPGTSLGRQYSAPTIERWYYEYRRGGLDSLRPRRRSDAGHARELTEKQRKLLLDIRREHPRATTSLILRTLELDGRLEKGAVSVSTVRRLYKDSGLDRLKLDAADGRVRLRWQADQILVLAHRAAHQIDELLSGELNLLGHGAS
jgi:transposase